MKDKNSDARDGPQNDNLDNECANSKKKKPDKDRKPGAETEETPDEEVDMETGLPPMKW